MALAGREGGRSTGSAESPIWSFSASSSRAVIALRNAAAEAERAGGSKGALAGAGAGDGSLGANDETGAAGSWKWPSRFWILPPFRIASNLLDILPTPGPAFATRPPFRTRDTG